MRTAYELCLATAGKQVPSGPDWIHEVKHDGYRMLVIRENERVRLFSKNGSDWTRRYPWIAEAALKNRQQHFVIDGEAVVRGVDGISDFNALHSREHDHEVQLYAFDILAMGGDDLRHLSLHMRKTNLQQLLARRPDGITAAPFERGEIGADLLRTKKMGVDFAGLFGSVTQGFLVWARAHQSDARSALIVVSARQPISQKSASSRVASLKITISSASRAGVA
jgi:bifunctional non-homologous end joining protein LigD